MNVRFSSNFQVSIYNPSNPSEKMPGLELKETLKHTLPKKFQATLNVSDHDADKLTLSVPDTHDEFVPGAVVGGLHAFLQEQNEMQNAMGGAFGMPTQAEPDSMGYLIEKLDDQGTVVSTHTFES